jgi:arsenate reductase (thioredoxin)
MAEAFAKMGGQIEAFSAGSKPSGVVNPKAKAAMREIGYDLSAHHSKSLEEIKQFAPFDAVITMGCGDACPWMPAKKFIDWEIPDPKTMDKENFNRVRDLIGENVKALTAQLTSQ